MSEIERMTVTVPAAMADMVRRAVADGDYESTSDVVREALAAWARQNDAGESDGLRDAIRAGLTSGPGIPVGTVFAELHARYADGG